MPNRLRAQKQAQTLFLARHQRPVDEYSRGSRHGDQSIPTGPVSISRDPSCHASGRRASDLQRQRGYARGRELARRREFEDI